MAKDDLFDEDGPLLVPAADIKAYLAPQASIGDDPRSLAALSCWIYKSVHKGQPTTAFSSPRPGAPLTATDSLPAGVSLPAPANGDEGYDAVALYEPAHRRLIIVNRGTESDADWIDNAATALFGKGKQVPLAVQYALAAVSAVGVANIAEVVCTGHSLGGGLADAQAALLNPALGTAVTVPVRAMGFASAGFSKSILALSAKTYGNLTDRAAITASTHYIRSNDPIRDQTRFGHHLAKVAPVNLNVFQLARYQNTVPRPPRSDWKISNYTLAHSAFLYFHLWKEGVDADGTMAPVRHLVRHESGRLRRWPGSKPSKIFLGPAVPQEFKA